MSKRPGGLGSLISKRAKLDKVSASTGGGGGGGGGSGRGRNPYLSHPILPDRSLQGFLMKCRTAALNFLPKEQRKLPIKVPFCEVEARLGILKVPGSLRRVVSTGAKSVRKPDGTMAVAPAFDCTQVEPRCAMESGVSRRHSTQWTGTGISECNAITSALLVNKPEELKQRPIEEKQMTETVYIGYADDRRICFPGLHPEQQAEPGKMETKSKLVTLDMTLPAAPYDVRVTLSSEKIFDKNLQEPLSGWKSKRIKRRWSYRRKDTKMAWQIDVTEVTTTSNPANGTMTTTVDHEIEMELQEGMMLQLINEENPEKLQQLTTTLAKQAWYILERLNPLADALDAEESLKEHPDSAAVQLALAQCGALRRAAEAHKRSGGGSTGAYAQPLPYDSPIGNPGANLAGLAKHNFLGCMPVNFGRHHLDDIQKSAANAYFCSEKTDGVRHLLVFLGETAVLIDRAMNGKQPIPIVKPPTPQDPFAPVLSLIQPGCVLDGEVVMNRKGGPKPRPIFIVFDVLSLSATQSIMHLPFEQRLKHLRKASFRTRTASRDMFDPADIKNARVPLPLVRKNFVARTDIDRLCENVFEERGMRIYSSGVAHNHLTDGIIFQPNLPYCCGTDLNLLKWKYLDTVTIDVELMALRHNDPDDFLRTGVLGEEQTRVDLSRFMSLPTSERLKLEADKYAVTSTGGSATIAEVGLCPETGEWYYMTFRPDKVIPNHISTCLGSLMELAEHITTEELRYRMSVPAGARDFYRKDLRGMYRQLLAYQRSRNQQNSP